MSHGVKMEIANGTGAGMKSIQFKVASILL
jgi:hypothetical protein